MESLLPYCYFKPVEPQPIRTRSKFFGSTSRISPPSVYLSTSKDRLFCPHSRVSELNKSFGYIRVECVKSREERKEGRSLVPLVVIGLVFVATSFLGLRALMSLKMMGGVNANCAAHGRALLLAFGFGLGLGFDGPRVSVCLAALKFALKHIQLENKGANLIQDFLNWCVNNPNPLNRKLKPVLGQHHIIPAPVFCACIRVIIGLSLPTVGPWLFQQITKRLLADTKEAKSDDESIKKPSLDVDIGYTSFHVKIGHQQADPWLK